MNNTNLQFNYNISNIFSNYETKSYTPHIDFIDKTTLTKNRKAFYTNQIKKLNEFYLKLKQLESIRILINNEINVPIRIVQIYDKFISINNTEILNREFGLQDFQIDIQKKILLGELLIPLIREIENKNENNYLKHKDMELIKSYQKIVAIRNYFCQENNVKKTDNPVNDIKSCLFLILNENVKLLPFTKSYNFLYYQTQ
jgi:hypothetical protein